MNKILVTGANGQLALSIKQLSWKISQYKFVFKSSEELDISDRNEVYRQLKNSDYIYCVNCAAYTNVEKAEIEKEKAVEVNSNGPKYLAEACELNGIVLIHISTDYVFDGKSNKPYKEEDPTNPINIYGMSKRDGELNVMNNCSKYFIIRTSWLYSKYGNNFFKTIMRLSKGQRQLEIINDQRGCPTYAGDLADLVLKIVNEGIDNYGLYHFSNLGQCSWFEFAKEIIMLNNISIDLKPISTKSYNTKVVRPENTTLSTRKIRTEFNIEIQHWSIQLERLIN